MSSNPNSIPIHTINPLKRNIARVHYNNLAPFPHTGVGTYTTIAPCPFGTIGTSGTYQANSDQYHSYVSEAQVDMAIKTRAQFEAERLTICNSIGTLEPWKFSDNGLGIEEGKTRTYDAPLGADKSPWMVTNNGFTVVADFRQDHETDFIASAEGVLTVLKTIGGVDITSISIRTVHTVVGVTNEVVEAHIEDTQISNITADGTSFYVSLKPNGIDPLVYGTYPVIIHLTAPIVTSPSEDFVTITTNFDFIAA